MDEGSRPTKRSRGLGLVTQNACSECRKKRAKCDGKQPSCSRCETSGVACQYEAPVRVRKDAMRDELQQLHTYRQQSELVLRSLTAEDKAADVLQRLRSGEALESIAARLTTGNIQTERRLVERPAYQTFDPYQAVFGQAAATPSLIDSSGLDTNMSNTIPGGGFEGSNLQYSMGGEMRFEWDAPHESPESSNVSQAGSSVMWSPDNVALSQTDVGARWPIVGSWGEPGRAGGISQRDRGQEFLFAPDPINQPQGLPAFDTTSWTNIKIDSNLMDHLLALYFCWEYVVVSVLLIW